MGEYLQGLVVINGVVIILLAVFLAGKTIGETAERRAVFQICKTGESLTKEADYAKLVLTCEVIK